MKGEGFSIQHSTFSIQHSPQHNKRYNYLITGAGAAGLSLLLRMIHSGEFNDKKILLVDKKPKINNDRTWCFWEKHTGFFEDVVYKRYEKLWFHGEGYSALNEIGPYQYKLIRGIDFYAYCFDIIKQQSNIEIIYGDVTAIHSRGNDTYAVIDQQVVYCDFIFNSILFAKPILKNKQFYLLQHFKGWLIETPGPSFIPGEATFMDFRVSQTHGTSFVYVLPFSPSRALIEYTLFTPSLLEPAGYEKGLKEYISKYLNIEKYEIIEEEFGIIPMTNYSFRKHDHRIIYIGTAGGQTKPSSGYTFQFIQKQSGRIVEALKKTGEPYFSDPITDKRFALYDSTLLNILYHQKLPGDYIFTQLFRNNPMVDVLKFLDNETSIPEEMRLITVLPKRIFLKAALDQLF